MRKVTQHVKKKVKSAIQPATIIPLFNSDYVHFLGNQMTKNYRYYSKQQSNYLAQVLKASAAQANSVGLSINQIGKQAKMFVINKQIQNNKLMASSFKDKLKIPCVSQVYNNSQDYEVFLSPRLIRGRGIQQFVEESISLPFIEFRVKRYKQIEVQYKDINHNIVNNVFTNQKAAIYQQIYQQLDGKLLLIWGVNHGNLCIQDQVQEYFPKTISVMEEYSIDLKKLLKDYPKLTEMGQTVQFQKQDYLKIKETVSIAQDFMRSMIKHYTRQMNLLQERIRTGALSNKPRLEQANSKSINIQIIKANK